MKNVNFENLGLIPLERSELVETNGGSAYSVGYAVGQAIGKAIAVVGACQTVDAIVEFFL